MTLTAALALLTLLVGVPLNWIVVHRAWEVYREGRIDNGRNLVALAQLVMFLALAVIVTVFAAVFVSNDLPKPLLEVDQTKLLTRSTIFLFGTIPASLYLWIYR